MFASDSIQRVKVGLEDVTQLVTVLHLLPDDASPPDVASTYDQTSKTDVDSLPRIVRLVSRQCVLPKVVIPAVLTNMVTRTKLDAIKPEYFSPSVMLQLSSSKLYRTVFHSANKTTSRLLGGVCVVVGLTVV